MQNEVMIVLLIYCMAFVTVKGYLEMALIWLLTNHEF